DEVGGCNRRIVGAGDGDRQRRRAGAAVVVLVRVGKLVGGRLAFGQVLDRRVAVVERVGVAAVAVEMQLAIGAVDVGADVGQLAVHGRNRVGVGGIDVRVVGQDV